jgi:uncharacterized protein (TIGR02594 family)
MPQNEFSVTATTLNVRAQPDIESKIVIVIKKGETVEVSDTSGDGLWYFVTTEKGKKGWSSYKWLVPAEHDEGADNSGEKYPWFAVAKREIGVAEDLTSDDNPRVVEYLNSTDLDSASAHNDETPWCSAFVNWCVETSGNEGTNSAWARSWLNWGKGTKTPVPGCIVVFTRGASSGHVAFFVKEKSNAIRVLGGNQSDKVCEADYPKSRLLGYRIPV